MVSTVNRLFPDFSDTVISAKEQRLSFSQANPHHDLAAIDLIVLKRIGQLPETGR